MTAQQLQLKVQKQSQLQQCFNNQGVGTIQQQQIPQHVQQHQQHLQQQLLQQNQPQLQQSSAGQTVVIPSVPGGVSTIIRQSGKHRRGSATSDVNK